MLFIPSSCTPFVFCLDENCCRVVQRCPERNLEEVIVRMEELEVELTNIVDNK